MYELWVYLAVVVCSVLSLCFEFPLVSRFILGSVFLGWQLFSLSTWNEIPLYSIVCGCYQELYHQSNSIYFLYCLFFVVVFKMFMVGFLWVLYAKSTCEFLLILGHIVFSESENMCLKSILENSQPLQTWIFPILSWNSY